MSENTWIVAATKKGCEHIAALNLWNQKYDYYLPMMHGLSGKDEPIFPGYIFVDIASRDGLWRPVQNTRGISHILMTGIRPGHMASRHIDKLKAREDAGIIRIREPLVEVTFEPGEAVTIEAGPFRGFEAVFQEVLAKDRVKVLLTVMGSASRVELSPADIGKPQISTAA